MTPIERFENKINKTDFCWEWLGSKNNKGYGNFGFMGKVEKAHRVAYKLYLGVDPNHLFVCHSCDNPSCVNPDHLYLGTNRENIIDASIKQRLAHKIANKDIPDIRKSSKSQRALARIYGVSQAQIWRIKNYKERQNHS